MRLQLKLIASLMLMITLNALAAPRFEIHDLQGYSYRPANLEINFRVVDKKSQRAPVDMNKFKTSYLKLFDNDRELSEFEAAGSLLSAPRNFCLDVMIVIDTSGSVKESLPKIQQAVKEFIQNTLAWADNDKRTVNIAILGFDGSRQLTRYVDFTNDPKLLLLAAKSISPGEDPSTNLYGAILNSDQLMRNRKERREIESRGKSIINRQTLVFFTDGRDQAGIETEAKAISAIHKSKDYYKTYAVAVDGELDSFIENNYGIKNQDYFFIDRGAEKLSKVFQLIAKGLTEFGNSFRTLRVCSPKRAKTHTLSIQLQGQEKIVIPYSAEGFGPGCDVNNHFQWGVF